MKLTKKVWLGCFIFLVLIAFIIIVIGGFLGVGPMSVIIDRSKTTVDSSTSFSYTVPAGKSDVLIMGVTSAKDTSIYILPNDPHERALYLKGFFDGYEMGVEQK